MNRTRIWIIFTIFLVMSMTPAMAMELGDSIDPNALEKENQPIYEPDFPPELWQEINLTNTNSETLEENIDNSNMVFLQSASSKDMVISLSGTVLDA